MGVYDIYAGVQLKCGPCELGDYEIGERVPIPDGIYLGVGGFVVVHDEKLLAVYDHMVTSWSDEVPARALADHYSPVRRAVLEIMKERDNED